MLVVSNILRIFRMPSGPSAFDVLSWFFFSSFSTPSDLRFNSGIVFFLRFQIFWSVLSLSRVTTELNCFISSSAFPLLSITRWPLLIRGAFLHYLVFLILHITRRVFRCCFLSLLVWWYLCIPIQLSCAFWFTETVFQFMAGQLKSPVRFMMF